MTYTNSNVQATKLQNVEAAYCSAVIKCDGAAQTAASAATQKIAMEGAGVERDHAATRLWQNRRIVAHDDQSEPISTYGPRAPSGDGIEGR